MESTANPPAQDAQDAPAPKPYETCEQCGSAVDHDQRYCVVCGTRRRTAPDPAARYMSAATSRSRTETRRERAGTLPAQRRAGSTLGTALIIALIPVGVLGGVLIGHHSNSSDSKLLAKLAAEKPQVVTVAGGAPSTASASSSDAGTTSDASLNTSFPLAKGYTVELSTLPSGTSTSDAQSAETSATGKGATGVGVLSLTTYTVSPAPKNAGFILYSGHYTSASQANTALKKLKKSFPSASVVSVKQAASGPTKVISKTKYGSASSAVNYKPSASALSKGAAVVKKTAAQSGKGYVGSQNGLPSVVSVP